MRCRPGSMEAADSTATRPQVAPPPLLARNLMPSFPSVAVQRSKLPPAGHAERSCCDVEATSLPSWPHCPTAPEAPCPQSAPCCQLCHQFVAQLPAIASAAKCGCEAASAAASALNQQFVAFVAAVSQDCIELVVALHKKCCPTYYSQFSHACCPTHYSHRTFQNQIDNPLQACLKGQQGESPCSLCGHRS